MALVLGLTEEQHAERLTGVGGSDAPKIMAGNWQEVWLEKTGRTKPKKIMSDWRYVLRDMTETLQMDFWEYRMGQRIIHRKASLHSPVYSFIRATMDGVIEETGEPVNAKHVSKWTPGWRTNDIQQWAFNEYYWQIIHEVVVLAPSTMRGWISLIVSDGEQEPERMSVDADPVSLDRLVETETEFWSYVQRDEPPDRNHPSVAPPVEWEMMRTENMEGNNVWSEFARIWLENRMAAARYDNAAKELKTQVKTDVREAYGYGVQIKRSRDGKLRVSEERTNV